MKKILLSIAVFAGFVASAQTTSSDLAGNVFTTGNTGFVYSFNTAFGLNQETLNCNPNTSNAVWDTYGSSPSGELAVDSISATNNNGFLKVTVPAQVLTGNTRQSSNRLPVGECGTAQGANVGDFSAEANQIITARVRATTDATIALVVATDDGGWKTHDAILESQTITGNAEWSVVTFEIADTAWNGVGDLTKVIGWELWYAGAQTLTAGEIHFDWITFGDATDPNVSSNEVVANGLNVYPNPATDVLNVKFDATAATTVELTDLTGKVVATQTAVAGSNSLSFATANVNAGVYFVNISNANGNTAQKVVIK